MLSWGDEYPIHQTPEPVAYSGSDRNFYDRYFYNGYNADGSWFFACAFGVYPHLNIMDGAVSVLREGRQRCVFLSRPLHMERMDTRVGGLSIEVLAPLERIRLRLEETEGLALDLEFAGRAFPIEEPRFTYREGPRMFIDCTRMTQNGRWSGRLEVDGEEVAVRPDGWRGTRDRSWGVRPIGAPDPQPRVPAGPPQFYWIWTPLNFSDRSVFFHVNEDRAGTVWNTRARIAPDGCDASGQLEIRNCRAQVTYASGTRRVKSGELFLPHPAGGELHLALEPFATFLMKGIGYGHPNWRHGSHHGEGLAVHREDYLSAAEPWHKPENLHIQAISRAVLIDERGARSEGLGSFEQLFVGPHATSGFQGFIDPAP